MITRWFELLNYTENNRIRRHLRIENQQSRTKIALAFKFLVTVRSFKMAKDRWTVLVGHFYYSSYSIAKRKAPKPRTAVEGHGVINPLTLVVRFEKRVEKCKDKDVKNEKLCQLQFNSHWFWHNSLTISIAIGKTPRARSIAVKLQFRRSWPQVWFWEAEPLHLEVNFEMFGSNRLWFIFIFRTSAIKIRYDTSVPPNWSIYFRDNNGEKGM